MMGRNIEDAKCGDADKAERGFMKKKKHPPVKQSMRKLSMASSSPKGERQNVNKPLRQRSSILDNNHKIGGVESRSRTDSRTSADVTQVRSTPKPANHGRSTLEDMSTSIIRGGFLNRYIGKNIVASITENVDKQGNGNASDGELRKSGVYEYQTNADQNDQANELGTIDNVCCRFVMESPRKPDEKKYCENHRSSFIGSQTPETNELINHSNYPHHIASVSDKSIDTLPTLVQPNLNGKQDFTGRPGCSMVNSASLRIFDEGYKSTSEERRSLDGFESSLVKGSSCTNIDGSANKKCASFYAGVVHSEHNNQNKDNRREAEGTEYCNSWHELDTDSKRSEPYNGLNETIGMRKNGYYDSNEDLRVSNESLAPERVNEGERQTSSNDRPSSGNDGHQVDGENMLDRVNISTTGANFKPAGQLQSENPTCPTALAQMPTNGDNNFDGKKKR